MEVYLLKNYTHIEFKRTISWVRGERVFYLDIRNPHSLYIRDYQELNFGGVKGVVRLKRKRINGTEPSVS